MEAWLAEVEGWGKTWGKGQKGEGYLPPRPTGLCAIEEEERPPDPTLPGEFCGSLPRVWVQHVGERAHAIREALEELTVDGLKHQVLTYTRPGTFTLTSPSTILTAATLRLLPLLYRLTKLLSLWTVRVAVLKAVPIFLKHLERSKWQLARAEAALQSLDADVFALLRENVERQILFAGGVMDNMLDILESYQDVLPDAWIVQLEDTEARYAQWVMDAERRVLQTQLQQPRKEAESQIRGLEEAREGLELEARRDEEVLHEVMEEAGEGERALEELMERSDEVAGAQLDGASTSGEDTTEQFDMIGLGLGGLEGLELEPRLVEEERGRRWKRHGSGDLSLPEEGLLDGPAVAKKVDPRTPAKVLAFIPSEEPTPRASPVMISIEEEVHDAGAEDRTGGAEVKDKVLSPQTAPCATEVDQQATTEATFTQEPSVAATSTTIAEPEHSAPSRTEELASDVINERAPSPEPALTAPLATHTDTVEPVVSAVDKQEIVPSDITIQPKEEPAATEITRNIESEETVEVDSPDHALPTFSEGETTSANVPPPVVGDQHSEPEIIEVAGPPAKTAEFGEIKQLNAVQQAPLDAEIEILQTEALRERDVPSEPSSVVGASESATHRESDVAIPLEENTVKHELLDADIGILQTEAPRERDVPSELDTVVEPSESEFGRESDVATSLEETKVKHELLDAEIDILQTEELHERDPGVLEPQFEMSTADEETENEQAEEVPATTEPPPVQPDAARQLPGALKISQPISSDEVPPASELDQVRATPEVTQESPQTEAIAAAVSADIEDLAVEDEYIVVSAGLKEEEPVVDVTEQSAIPNPETTKAADPVKSAVPVEDIDVVKSSAVSDAEPAANVPEVAIEVVEAALQSEEDAVEAPKLSLEVAPMADLEFEPIVEVAAIVDEKVDGDSTPATEIQQAAAVVTAETAPQPPTGQHEQLAKATEQPLAPTEEPTPRATPTVASKASDDIGSIQDMPETASVPNPQEPSLPPRSESASSLVESDRSSTVDVLPAVSNSDSKDCSTLDAAIPSPPPGSTISTPESVSARTQDEPEEMQLQVPEGSPKPALLPSPVFMSAKEEILLEAEARDEDVGIRSLGTSRAATPDNSNGVLAGLGIMTGSDESSIELDNSDAPEARTPEFEDDDFEVSDEDIVEETYLFTTPPVRPSTAGQSSRRSSHVMAPDLPSILESSPRPAKEGYFGGAFTEEMLPPPLPRFVRPAKRLSVKSQAAKFESADGSVKYKANGKGKGKGKTSAQSAFRSPATPNTEVCYQDIEVDGSGADYSAQIGRNAGPVTDDSPFSNPPVLSPASATPTWARSPAGVLPLTPSDFSSPERPSSREATPETHPQPRKITVAKRLPGERTARPVPTAIRATSNPQDPGPRTPKKAPTSMDDHVNYLLQSLPRAVKLTSSNLAALNATKPIPFSLSSTPASDSGASQTPSYAASTTSRPRNSSVQADIKCYHLHRSDNAPPMKLYVRLVGNARLVCRVGGGWSDLEEYLKEWALHHGSKMRKVSESLTVQDIPVHNGPAGQRTLRPSASNSSLNRSRPTSPAPRAASPAYSNSPPRAAPVFAGTVEISPPVAARPGSSHSLRRKSSRLSFSEGVDEVEEKPKMLGLAGPRGKKKELGGESMKWIEGMLGQVRQASVSRAAEMEDALDEDEGEPEVKVKVRQRSVSNVSAGVGDSAVRRVFVTKGGGRKSLGAGGVGGIGK